MSRAIKFRAWDIEEKTMFDNPDIAECSKGNYPVMQFTGLKDKNGQDIYERDIVEFGPYPDQRKRLIGCVTFRDGCFGVDVPGKVFYSFPGWKLFDVIGNIYENPELLRNGA